MEKVKISIPGKPDYITMVRLVSGSMASIAGFDIESAEDLKMAVAEACKLVSCHGEEGFSEKYNIEFEINQNSVEILIVDDCTSHKIEKIKKPCQMCPAEGNLGRDVIKSLVDKMEVGKTAAGHKYIRMVKRV